MSYKQGVSSSSLLAPTSSSQDSTKQTAVILKGLLARAALAFLDDQPLLRSGRPRFGQQLPLTGCAAVDFAACRDSRPVIFDEQVQDRGAWWPELTK
jgi:hypothetical protein